MMCSPWDDSLFFVRLLYSCASSLSRTFVNASDQPESIPRYDILFRTEDSKTALMVSGGGDQGLHFLK